jgi:hypothetical protein
MSDSTPIATPILRRLRSPFNGAVWIVPPDMPEPMYLALLERGFFAVDADDKPAKKEPKRER